MAAVWMIRSHNNKQKPIISVQGTELMGFLLLFYINLLGNRFWNVQGLSCIGHCMGMGKIIQGCEFKCAANGKAIFF